MRRFKESVGGPLVVAVALVVSFALVAVATAQLAFAEEIPEGLEVPVWTCDDGTGHPVQIAWGTDGPPPVEQWDPSTHCSDVDVWQTGEADVPLPSEPRDVDAVEVLPNVWTPAADAALVTAYLRAVFLSIWGPVMDCVAAVESHGSYTAENPTSTASGRYQFLISTSNYMAPRIGHPELVGVPAGAWPPHLQDAAFVDLVHAQGDSVEPAWRGHGRRCDGLIP